MPQSKTDVKEDSKVIQEPKLKLVPSFEKEQDIKLAEVPEISLSTKEKDLIDEICPHYQILKNRYREYKNPDPTGNSDGLPLRIDRKHELAIFEAVLAQALLSKGLKVTPDRIIKCFVYETDESGKEVRKTKLIIDKLVQGERMDGSPTAVAHIRVGYYRYPKQFQQDLDGEWSPINNRFEKVWYLDFDKDIVESLSLVGNPYTKKYCVWHPNGELRKYYRKEQFINLTDDEQIKDMEKPKDQQVR
jgi:hypothetical protein